MKKIVFIDRDGTIIVEPADKQIDSLEKLEFLPGAVTGLQMLIESGYGLVMVTNQDGLGTRSFPRRAFAPAHRKMLTLLRGEGIVFDEIFVCPHVPSDKCTCRKPLTGLVDRFCARTRFDRSHSFVLGDRETDVAFACNLGIRAVRITGHRRTAAEYRTASVLDACRYIAAAFRTAEIRRTTKETAIAGSIALDGAGRYSVKTGIGFFDHMLAQLARHSGADLVLRVEGDLEIDEHHTVEDTGIALGEAIRKALGDKRGIARFAFAAPLDEALAEVALDLSGRSVLSFSCPFKRERVGELPTELVEDFFRGFADGLGATIHIRCRGRNDHHKVEAIFKAVARALRQATTIDRRRRLVLPSTKGKL
jgi:imidazoleglycerol-phosphate dehydratase/histidinol-phosphatase